VACSLWCFYYGNLSHILMCVGNVLICSRNCFRFIVATGSWYKLQFDFLFFIFLSASRLGTVVVSDHTHALPLYTRTPPHATVYKQTYNYTQIKDRVLLEITRIFRFRRRRARHIPFVAPRMRGEREYSWETTVPGEKTSAIQGPNTGRQRAHLQR
jgi:hypothetical protein